ncbi:MAG: GHMP kinase [Candidatus Bathyarchaeota archaeon]|nr:GHMP kinase [Candidatus Bathyarchaeota archaeon]
MKEDLRDLLKNPQRYFGKGPWTIASAPGRADFLNTHQDYKGLHVVPVGIDLRTFIFAKVLNGGIFRVRSLNLEEELGEPCVDIFRVGKNDMLRKGWFGNYFRGIINVLVERVQAHKLKGLDAIIKSQIPIGSGLGSSAALEIAFLKLLDHLFNFGYTKKDLAEIAYLAETKEVGVPCGRLDHYGSIFGGIIKLECRYPFHVEQLPFTDIIFVIIDSGIRHATMDIHPVRQRGINDGLKVLMESEKVSAKLKAKLGYRYDEPLWERISEEEINPHLSLLDEKVRKRILYTLKTQKSTEFGLRILRGKTELAETIRQKLILGEIMNQQHELLRDLYEVSLPKLEKIREAAIEVGAYGVKISGAGLGGSLIALVKDFSMGTEVLDASLSAGAKQGWISKVAPGAKIESCKHKIQ